MFKLIFTVSISAILGYVHSSPIQFGPPKFGINRGDQQRNGLFPKGVLSGDYNFFDQFYSVGDKQDILKPFENIVEDPVINIGFSDFKRRFLNPSINFEEGFPNFALTDKFDDKSSDIQLPEEVFFNAIRGPDYEFTADYNASDVLFDYNASDYNASDFLFDYNASDVLFDSTNASDYFDFQHFIFGADLTNESDYSEFQQFPDFLHFFEEFKKPEKAALLIEVGGVGAIAYPGGEIPLLPDRLGIFGFPLGGRYDVSFSDFPLNDVGAFAYPDGIYPMRPKRHGVVPLLPNTRGIVGFPGPDQFSIFPGARGEFDISLGNEYAESKSSFDPFNEFLFDPKFLFGLKNPFGAKFPFAEDNSFQFNPSDIFKVATTTPAFFGVTKAYVLPDMRYEVPPQQHI